MLIRFRKIKVAKGDIMLRTLNREDNYTCVWHVVEMRDNEIALYQIANLDGNPVIRLVHLYHVVQNTLLWLIAYHSAFLYY